MSTQNETFGMSRGRSNLTFYSLLTFTTIFWGGAFPAGKIVAEILPPATAAGIRFLIALPLFFLLTKLWGEKIIIPRKLHLYAALYGLMQVTAYNYLFFEGISHTTSSSAVLIISSAPAITALIASLVYKDEKLTPFKSLGILIAFAGVTLIVILGAQGAIVGNFRGDILIFLSGLVFSIYTIYSKIVLKYLSPIQLTSWGTFYGVIALWIIAIPEDRSGISISAELIWAMLYLAILAGVFGFLFYNIGAKELGPSKVAIFMNLVPVFGVLTSVLVLGEELSIWHPLAFLFVLSGVVLVNRSKMKSLSK